MLFRCTLIVLLSTCLASHLHHQFESTTAPSVDSEVEELLGKIAENETDSDVNILPVMISNPWIRTDKLEHGFENVTIWNSKSVVPRLFSDMGRAGFPPIEDVMKWPCWNGVDEKAKEEFIEIFNETNTKGMMKAELDKWIDKYNGTDIAEKIRWNRDDFNSRMRLFSINFESALSTFSTAVRTFNDVAMDDGMTIAESNAVINNIADILDKNFSLKHLFNGNVMNGKKLQQMIVKAATTTLKPNRITAPPHWGNSTGNGKGVWNGNWKRYTVVRRVTNKPVQTTPQA